MTRAVRDMGLGARPICIHGSLKSFGWVEGGARALVDAFLEENCTVCVPTFTEFGVPPPTGWRLEQNGWDYDRFPGATIGVGRIYSPDTAEIAGDMGAIPKAVLAMPGRVRGSHPLCSFTALGPMAGEIISGQSPRDVCAPLRSLAERNGLVVLMGVGLNNMTLLHLAEKQAGRNLFLRWANDPQGDPEVVEVGGCSNGFNNLEYALNSQEQRALVGQSIWRVFNAKNVLDTAAKAIRENPDLTHCGKPDCERCNDAVLGGPLSGY